MKKLFLLFLAGLVLQSCKSSYLNQSTNVSGQKKQYDKILVVSRTSDITTRISSEKSIVSALSQNGINAEASSNVIETKTFVTKPTVDELNEMVTRLIEQGYNGVIITNLIDSSEYTDVIPGNSVGYGAMPVRYGRFGRYYGAYPISTWEPDRISTGVQYILESCLYDLRTKSGDNLQWVGRFKIKDPSNLSKTTDNYSRELSEALIENSISK